MSDEELTVIFVPDRTNTTVSNCTVPGSYGKGQWLVRSREVGLMLSSPKSLPRNFLRHSLSRAVIRSFYGVCHARRVFDTIRSRTEGILGVSCILLLTAFN